MGVLSFVHNIDKELSVRSRMIAHRGLFSPSRIDVRISFGVTSMMNANVELSGAKKEVEEDAPLK